MIDKSIKADRVENAVLVTGDTKDVFNIINNLAAEEKKTLSEAAAEIQELLDQLSKSYPTKTLAEKANVAAKAIEVIEKKPDTKAKIIKALKVGGKEALIKLTNNPVVKILTPLLESLLENSK